jgi:hypothetical protein
MFLPSAYPFSFKPSRNDAMISADASGEFPESSPITRVADVCCARAPRATRPSLRAPQRTPSVSLYYLVSDGKQRFRDHEAQGLSGFQIDDQSDLHGLLNGKFTGLLAL